MQGLSRPSDVIFRNLQNPIWFLQNFTEPGKREKIHLSTLPPFRKSTNLTLGADPVADGGCLETETFSMIESRTNFAAAAVGYAATHFVTQPAEGIPLHTLQTHTHTVISYNNNNLTCKAPVCAKRKTSVALADRTSR